MPIVAAVARQAMAELAWRTAKFLVYALLGAALLLAGCQANAGLGLLAVSQGGHMVPAPSGGGLIVELPQMSPAPGPVPSAGERVTDAQRYALALGAWGNVPNAILATALSMAEDCGGPITPPHNVCWGNPIAHSATNFDGSFDFGLWQINSGWHARFGGVQALGVPVNNAAAAYTIFTLQGWCAWSTYEEACGRGHVGTYRAYLACARILSGGGVCR